MQPVLTAAEMRAADAAALGSLTHETLVGRAGTAVAMTALKILGGAYGRRVIVVVGKGSNGADGRVAAAHLASRGVKVEVIDAASAPASLGRCDLVIDGAYGTGFRGTYVAPKISPSTPVLAIDLPSGLNADTGEGCEGAFHATHTVTFAARKTGLVQGDGPRLSGRITVADIGVPTTTASAALITDDDVRALVPPRPRQSHKWTTALGIAAGSVGMEGSAVLSTRGAMAAGAGMIRLGSPGNPTASWPVEAVRVSLDAFAWAESFLDATTKCLALVIGPGLGHDERTQEEIRAVVAAASVPVVIDADGLNALGEGADVRRLLAQRVAPTVLTPHDGEYARLAGSSPGADRLAAARHLAAQCGAIVLLKGPLTAVATNDGAPTDILLANAGVPALATAGTGDVLSGIIGAFLARGVPAHHAAALGAHVHGRAAALGAPEGLRAGQLPDLVARFLSEQSRRG